MAYRCPQCGAEHDAALFQFGIAVRCDCGALVPARHVESAPDREERIYRRFQRQADRIAYLIVATDCPEIDIQIERRNLKALCRDLFPDRLDLFEMIYEARFRRLWEQFRR